MTETPQQRTPIISRLWSAWLGLLIFGFMSATAYSTFAISQQPIEQALRSTTASLIIGALLLIVVTGLTALFAYRAGRTGLAAGLVVGYLIMSLVSQGTCALLQDPFQGGYSALSGAIYYAIAIAASLLLLAVASLVNFVIQRRKAP